MVRTRKYVCIDAMQKKMKIGKAAYGDEMRRDACVIHSPIALELIAEAG